MKRRTVARAVLCALLMAAAVPAAEVVCGRRLALTVITLTIAGNLTVTGLLLRPMWVDQVRVSLNHEDITSLFRRDQSTHTLLGLASGLADGPNALGVAATGAYGSHRALLNVTNHPGVGPIFSGPHEQPFICETDAFKLHSGATLGKPLDANCSINRRVDYYYRSTAGGSLKPFASSSTPPDLARVTTLEGAAVPYIVRMCSGSLEMSNASLASICIR